MRRNCKAAPVSKTGAAFPLWTYAGFKKSLELYNLDHAILDDEAVAQTKSAEHVLVVEGPFDVARLYAAGIRNVVATFGASLSTAQIRRLGLISEMIDVNRFLFFYDRDRAGRKGVEKALEAITASGLGIQAEVFDWNRIWESTVRGDVGIPVMVPITLMASCIIFKPLKINHLAKFGEAAFSSSFAHVLSESGPVWGGSAGKAARLPTGAALRRVTLCPSSRPLQFA